MTEQRFPCVQIWPYAKAPAWAQIWYDDVDWCVFVPDFLENEIDVESDLSSLMICDWHGPETVPGGKVWVACHA